MFGLSGGFFVNRKFNNFKNAILLKLSVKYIYIYIWNI